MPGRTAGAVRSEHALAGPLRGEGRRTRRRPQNDPSVGGRVSTARRGRTRVGESSVSTPGRSAVERSSAGDHAGAHAGVETLGEGRHLPNVEATGDLLRHGVVPEPSQATAHRELKRLEAQHRTFTGTTARNRDIATRPKRPYGKLSQPRRGST